MKKLVIAFALLFVFSISAEAQTGGGMTPEQKGQMDKGRQMPMMQMCMPMMMGQGMMMRDMMQMMMDTMKIQQKMMHGMKPAEKKQMMMEMDKMMGKMEKMMSEMRGMMMKGMIGTPPVETKKEEAPAKEEAPKTDPHKH